MDIYYNPLDINCKSVCGGIRQNENLTIKVFGDSCEPCIFVLKQDGCEAQYLHMQQIDSGWKIDLSFNEIGLYFYYFIIGKRVAGLGKYRNLEFSEKINYYQLLIYSNDFETPDWFKGGIMYQIFPDRFFKDGNVFLEKGKLLHTNWNEMPEYRMNEHGKILNNDFFGGNFRGIIQKLDYLKTLNVTIIYLNPIFRAHSNHRYDTGDYMQIDPALGIEEDFAAFITECEKRGISVILDGVFNHTGDDSRYFNKYGTYNEVGAYQSKDSKYYAWYNFEEFPDKYDSWWGIDVLPAVNEKNSSYVEFITGNKGVLKHWMKYPIGGYRLDVADELPDEFIEKIRDAVKSADKNAVLIGEVWEDASNKIAYGKRRKYFQGKELDSVMNYPLKDAVINFMISGNTTLLRQTIAMLLDNYPKCVLDSLMNILGTHDTARILTVLSGVPAYSKEEMSILRLNSVQRHEAKEKLKAAAVLTFTLFGVPCIYYGDEIGMEGYSDPFCRMPFQWDDIDEEILSFYRTLTAIRSELTVFKEGIYKEIFTDANCIVFERRTKAEVAVICVNCGGNKFNLTFNGILYDLLENKVFYEKYEIFPFSYSILTNKMINI